jgi:REP element-mobilizing transposase RayT
MGRSARSESFNPAEVSVFHCINRCVRRCFLCGKDPLTGANYEHRREWIEARIKYLAAYFGIDVLSFAVLENHFHVILRNRPDSVANWSDEEVAIRWLMLCPVRKSDDGSAERPAPPEIAMIVNDPERLAEIRTRLSHISWFMRMVAEPVARRANLEENVSGRFWQGRFRSVKLCDEAAVLACSVYVDLNPVRAGISQAVEDGPHTSAALRAKTLREPECKADASLAPITLNERTPRPKPTSSGDRCSDKGFLPLSVEDYLQLPIGRAADSIQADCARTTSPVVSNPVFQLVATDGYHPLDQSDESQALLEVTDLSNIVENQRTSKAHEKRPGEGPGAFRQIRDSTCF